MKSRKDTHIQKYIEAQKKLESEQINLIASESYAPQSVLNALGSMLTNKYSEGYPGKRYYPGNDIYDEIELLAQQRALDLFTLSPRKWSVNVQSYSGAIANAEIYAALLGPGDVILSLDLASGGHLSHGSKISITSKLYTVYHYGVDTKYRINYKQVEELAYIHRPKLIISGASAYPFKINFKKIGAIAKKVGAYHLADISHYAGLISAGIYPSPFTIADVVMSTTHKSLCGPRGAIIWSRKELSEKINKAVFPGTQGGPHMNTIAALAEGLEIAQKSKAYYIQVIENMKIFVSEFKRRGQIIVGGGSESHMLLLDVRPFGLHGGDAEFILSQVGILANRNIIVGDSSVQRPSAIRIGTYAITQRGMKEKQIKQIVQLICSVLGGKGNMRDAQQTVKKITQTFPILR
ncbi:MAG: serine hydroxymethyltransferase [Candidatus Paceibacterota bacterium]